MYGAFRELHVAPRTPIFSQGAVPDFFYLVECAEGRAWSRARQPRSATLRGEVCDGKSLEKGAEIDQFRKILKQKIEEFSILIIHSRKSKKYCLNTNMSLLKKQ